MDVIRGDVRKLVNKELNATNKRFRPFASPHEGQIRGKNFKKSVKWLSVWQWKRFR